MTNVTYANGPENDTQPRKRPLAAHDGVWRNICAYGKVAIFNMIAYAYTIRLTTGIEHDHAARHVDSRVVQADDAYIVLPVE